MSCDSADGPKVEDEGREASSPEHQRRDLEEKFNMQRAKMKELFLQKEEEMRKMLEEKEQLQSEVVGLRASLQQLHTLSQNQVSEIQSLQLLVNETVEASSSGNEEVRRLRARTLELEQNLGQLRQQQQQQEVSLAPATIVRNLARKLGTDFDDQPARKNVEDAELARSMLQPMELEIAALKHKLRDTDAQLQEALNVEDAELARSMLQPMELEIAALKHKLRDTDAQLQEALKSQATATTTTAPASGDTKNELDSVRECDMCRNYEKQLVSEQREAEAARSRGDSFELALKHAAHELEAVRALHDDTVRTWQAERGAASSELATLKETVTAAQAAVEQGASAASLASQRALHHVTSLTVERETLQRRLDSLERDNAMLIGQYLKKAEEMQNEIIDLPDNVEELQELTLRLREQLIFCQIGREEAAEAERELRNQLLEQGSLFHQQESEMTAVRAENRQIREELDRLQTEHEQMKELGDKLRHSNDMIEGLLNDKKRLQSEVAEIRGRVSVLQQELDNSEKVQQDFVRLSQSLQVQLQRIREADTEVRWQNDDDVTQCPACHTSLPNQKKKVHCRHCGRIYCGSCVSHTVPAGPRRLPARVCAVCRTLLQPHTAPYFSTAPPHSPH